IDAGVYPGILLLKSVHIIVIESLRVWFCELKQDNLLEVILQGKSGRLINPGLPKVNIHQFFIILGNLFYWIVFPVVQADLDEFHIWWNQHTIRHQPEKDMPSGHVPQDAVEHP
ncbi:hypothetical protein BDN70DRAFT_785322, partial [Pholiota conissans]